MQLPIVSSCNISDLQSSCTSFSCSSISVPEKTAFAFRGAVIILAVTRCELAFCVR